MGNQLTTCCGLCPRDEGGDSSYEDTEESSCGHCGESGGQGGNDDGVFGDDTSPLIRDGSGIARNAGAVGSEHLHGSSYARGQSYSNKEVDPLLLGVDHFAPSHDPDNAHQQQQDDEQQRVLSHLVHGFAGEIVDCSGPDGVTTAVANVTVSSTNSSNDRSSNASGGNGTSGGGVAVLDAAEAGERAVDYGKNLSRAAADLTKRHLDSLGFKGTRGMEDVSIPQVEAYLNQRAEGVLTDADQVLVTEVASRAGEVMARAGPINVAESEIAVPYGGASTTPARKKKTSSSSSADRK